jgi:hypothetical protein
MELILVGLGNLIRFPQVMEAGVLLLGVLLTLELAETHDHLRATGFISVSPSPNVDATANLLSNFERRGYKQLSATVMQKILRNVRNF